MLDPSDGQVLIAVMIVSGLVLAVGLFSRLLSMSPVSPPLVVLLLGLILRPCFAAVPDAGDPGFKPEIFEEVCRLTLAVGLMGTALELPRRDLLRRWKTLSVLLGIVMPISALITGALVHLLLGVPILLGVLIGTVLMPTDPILARSITSGEIAMRNLPARVRYTLLDESGINDGLAYPFVMLVILLLQKPQSSGILSWFTDTVLWAVCGSVVIGFVIGSGAGRLLRWSRDRGYATDSSYLAHAVALSLFSVTLARLLHSDGVLASFFTGIAFANTREEQERQEARRIQEAINHFFVLPSFFLLGTALPWRSWLGWGWLSLFLVIVILVLRRLPAVVALRPLMHHQMSNMRDAAFVGWFGPMGISAVFYAALAFQGTGADDVWTISTLAVTGSVVVHGVTANWLTRMVGRRR